jgi:hypothetical protein
MPKEIPDASHDLNKVDCVTERLAQLSGFFSPVTECSERNSKVY